MIFIPNDNTTKILQPSKQTFNLPTASISPEFSSILRGRFNTIFFVRRDQFNSFSFQSLIQRVAVISLISYKFLGRFFDVSSLKRFFDKSDFMRASTGHVHRERKTTAVCHCHELRTFAPLGLSNVQTPFFAMTNVPSTKHSVKSKSPRLHKSSANALKIFSKVPSLTHLWKRLWQVWYGGYRSGISCQGAPVRNIHNIPLTTALVSFQGRPRPSGRLGSLGISGTNKAHWSSFKSMAHLLNSILPEVSFYENLFMR